MISERIRILREKNNMTQALLAKRLNITRSSVNAWAPVPAASPAALNLERRLDVPDEPIVPLIFPSCFPLKLNSCTLQ